MFSLCHAAWFLRETPRCRFIPPRAPHGALFSVPRRAVQDGNALASTSNKRFFQASVIPVILFNYTDGIIRKHSVLDAEYCVHRFGVFEKESVMPNAQTDNDIEFRCLIVEYFSL